MAGMLLCLAINWYFCTYFASGLLVVQGPSIIMESDNFSLICSISAGSTPDWFLPNETKASLGCLKNPVLTYVDVFCDTTGPVNNYTLFITGAEVDRDDGNYSCRAATESAITTVDIHVERSITNFEPAPLVVSEGNFYNVSCSTSCGYPTTVTWYTVQNGTHQHITDVPDEDADTCSNTTKLRNVTSTVRFQGENVDALKCCVINTDDESDRSTCEIIGVTYVATSTTPTTPTTSDSNIEDHLSLPGDQVNVTNGDTVTLTADLCSEADDSTVGWYSGKENCKYEDDLNENDLERGNETNLQSQCTDSIQLPFRTRSTWTATGSEVACVTCCIIDRHKLTANVGTCVVIKIIWLTVWWWWCWCNLTICIIIIVTSVVVPCGVIIGICVFVIKRKKKKCKKCKKPKKDCKCPQEPIDDLPEEPYCARHHRQHCTDTECKTNAEKANKESKGHGRARKTGDIPEGTSAASNGNTGNGYEDHDPYRQRVTTNESTRRSVILPPIAVSIAKKKKGKKSHRTPRTDVLSDN